MHSVQEETHKRPDIVQNEKFHSKKEMKKSETINIILIILLIIIANFVYVSKFMKKDIIKVKPKKTLFVSYPMKSTNPRYDLLRQINKWYSKKLKKVSNPSHWPGEEGKAVIIPANMKEISENRFNENQFNIVASDMIALDRQIPDNREKG